MFRRYNFWLKTAVVFQLLTGLIHSLSLFKKPVPQNDQEKQLIDLMYSYKMDLGAGFHPSMGDLLLALSSCFTLAYLLGGCINWYLILKKADVTLIKGITGIQLFIFGAAFIIMSAYTFLPPIVLTAIVFVCLLLSYLLNRNR